MRTWKFFLLLLLTTSCILNNNKPKATFNYDENQLYSFILDTFLIQKANYFTICGNYYSEMPDSLLSIKLRKFTDPILKERDIDFIVSQYTKNKGVELKEHLELSKYFLIEKLDDYEFYKFHNIHFAISPPMYTTGHDTCIVYIHAFIDKKGQTGAFIAFVKNNNVWEHPFFIVDENPFEPENYHQHNYSIIDSTMFNSDSSSPQLSVE